MAGKGPDWAGLLKWSVKQSDGTRPSRQISEEDRKWFQEAMSAQTIDVIKRMKEITMVMNIPSETLQEQGVTVEELESMLEELQDHVECIDMANDLHAIGGLKPLLGFLHSKEPCLRARAAEVVSTMVQNNPKSQQNIMNAGGLEPLIYNFTSDEDVLVRTKSLGAISQLIRHNKAGLEAFRMSAGFSKLKEAMTSDHPKLRRKALSVLLYVIEASPSDSKSTIRLGFVKPLVSMASSNSNWEIREAALLVLQELARRGGEEVQACKEEGMLKENLTARIDEIVQGKGDASMEERMLIDALWQECYKQTSPLREKSLLLPIHSGERPVISEEAVGEAGSFERDAAGADEQVAAAAATTAPAGSAGEKTAGSTDSTGRGAEGRKEGASPVLSLTAPPGRG
ncbi:hypothetical protein CBR_g66724 [Chara braunii]|uniref:TOG domain-containing protein n=1 Tax=Chara braunii TaxID=69332 RepID=A0A388JQ73_CHABU|nr:hypothetical protein CBR_g66724 [Chara braunii]|eukprot:GBG59918.1 hypothetical protein CBR_g66724 [Chara braunii]